MFAAGADLKQALAIVDQPGEVERFISTGQRLFADLQHAPVPVVGALTGSALAGGFELLLHCHAIQAHAESAMVTSGEGYQRELEQVLLELLCRSTESDWYEHFLDYERATEVSLFARPEVHARIRHLMEGRRWGR